MLALAVVLALVVASAASTSSAAGIWLEWEEVSRRPHDSEAFTQGLLLDESGRLFESTGRRGESTLREVDPLDGTVLRSLRLPDDWFGEGLALVEGDLIQLTWTTGVAERRRADTFELVERYRYGGAGWGLCFDGERLVMSDGSDRLTFRDPDTFEALEQVEVTLEGRAVPRLNELECVEGAVWANVWQTDAIVRIDPRDGRVTGVLDLRDLIDPHPADAVSSAVLNGIAYDAAAGTFMVTGKLWPVMIEIRILEERTDADQPANGARG